jgi:HAE1 family hydrophobic/amphiphilic exporter-1
LPALSVHRPVAVSVCFIGVVFLGLISYARLPVDLLPKISYPKLVIYTRYPNVGPAEVERLVTERIERQLARVPGVERLESASREGVSLVSLRFAWGTNMDYALLNVRQQLDNMRDLLPALSERPVVLRSDPAAEPIMALSLAGADLATLKDVAEAVFKRRLEQIEGIAEAAVTGGWVREIHVEVDPAKLAAYGVTLEDVSAALAAANVSAPGGTILRGRYRYALRTYGEFQSVQEIERVPLRRPPTAAARGVIGTSGGVSASSSSSPDAAGALIAVGDVATVEDGFAPREAITRFNGKESVGLLLFKEAGANTVRTADRAMRAVGQLRAQYPGLAIAVAMNQARFIRDAIANVVQALVLGGMLAFAVLFFFLHDPRYPVAVALAIPISVVATFSLLDLAGASLNLMSLGGLALGVGMLVDNSIVVLENVFRHREAGAGPVESAIRGAEEVQLAIIASTLTTVAVFAPIVYVKGLAGQLFGDVSLAVTFALLASLVVALTMLPLLAARWAKHGAGPGSPVLLAHLFAGFDRSFDRFAQWYHRTLMRALDHRGHVAAAAAGAVLGAIVLGVMLDRSLLPRVDQGALAARLELPAGTPLEETARLAGSLEQYLLADRDVAAVFTRVGRQELLSGAADDESGLNTATFDVTLKPGRRTAALVARLRRAFRGLPPGVLAVHAAGAATMGQVLSGTDADLAIRIRGEDLDQAVGYARAVGQRLASLPALANVRLAMRQAQPEIQLTILRDRAAAFGVEPRLVARTIEQAMSGAVATDYAAFDRTVPVIVRLPPEARQSLATLQRLSVNGVPVRELVRQEERLGPTEIRRLDQSRVVSLYADAAKGGWNAAARAVRAALASQPPPRGLRLEVGGANEERAKSFRDLGLAFALALALVYLILAAQFESLVHPFTILVSVPLALVGAVLALLLTRQSLNTMSVIGIVILVGIAVNDAIVKVDFINRARRGGLPLREALLLAGRARLRPILMTSVTTILGLLPMALGFGRGADLRAPLAIALIGGLTSSTLLTLIVIPVAYDLIEEGAARLRRRREAWAAAFWRVTRSP